MHPSAATRPPLLLDRPWVRGGLIALLTLAAYSSALHGDFIWDDDRYVQENPTLRSTDGLRQIWFDIGATPQYYPLVHTTFWIEYRLWGLNASGYHLVNFLLHAGAALFLWRVLLRLVLPGAWLAAAVFAVHPVHVESVAWITERKNVLAGVCYFAAALAYLTYAAPPGEGDRRRLTSWYWVALGLFLCALLSKTVAGSLPAALLLVLWWKQGRVRWPDVRALLPFFVAAIGLGLVTVWMEKHHVGASGAEWDLSLVERCLIAGRAVWFYLGKLLLPLNLTFIYPRWEIDSGFWPAYLFPLSALAVVAALWLLRRRIGNGPLIATLFFGGTLFPALGFFDVYPMRYSFVADHFQYLASAGMIVLFVSGAAGLLRGSSIRVNLALSALLLVLLAAGTWRRGLVYDGLETLWRDTIARNPDAWIAQNNLAITLRAAGRVEEAIPHYREAMRLNPDDAQPPYNLANALSAVGRYEEALPLYLTALELRPAYADASSNLGSTLQALGRTDEAIDRFRQAVALDPASVETRYNLALALHSQGVLDQAITEYAEAIRLRPGSAAMHYNLGVALFSARRFDEAVRHYTESARLRPASPETQYALGAALSAAGRGEAALAPLREAVRLRPDWPVPLNELAWKLATDPDPARRQGLQAIELAQRAAELTRYENPVILDTLAAGYAAAGQFERAVTTAETALRLAAENPDAAELVQRIPERLRLYRQERPFVDPATPG